MAKDVELLEVEEKLPSEEKPVKIEKKPVDEKQKEQLIALGFIICIAFLITIAAFTAINTRAVDKLTERIEAI